MAIVAKILLRKSAMLAIPVPFVRVDMFPMVAMPQTAGAGM
jgi:hypothetical protein